MKIRKSRAIEHIANCELVRDDCKFISEAAPWKIISSKLDKGAFQRFEVGDDSFLRFMIDGTSDVFEWGSNARIFAREGCHRGFLRSAKELYEDIKDIKTDYTVSDDHSRGAPIALLILMLKFCDYHGIDWKKYGLYKAIRKWKKAGENYNPCFNTPQIVTSGSPVVITGKMKRLLQSLKVQPFDHHALRTKKDPVYKISQKGRLNYLLIPPFLRLHHITHFTYDLPTAPGIDHLTQQYLKAIIKSSKEIWREE